MSPKDLEPTGTTTATQMSHKMASWAGGTQTTPQPSPKKPTLTGGMQTSPPKDNSWEQVGQGQLECNQDKEGQQMENTSSKGKKNKKLTSEAQPHPGPSTGSLAGPRNDFTSRNLGTGRLTIQCTVYSVGSIHTGEGSAHMIIIAQHVIIMIMLHTCVGLTDRPTIKVNRTQFIQLLQKTLGQQGTIT